MLEPMLLAALLASVQREPALQFTFIGNAAVQVSDGALTLLSDFPYQSGAFGYMTYDASRAAPRGDVVVLITHAHRDHFDPGAPRDGRWRLIGPQDAGRGFTPVERVAPGAAVHLAGGVRVTALRTRHRDVPHFSYRVDWRGRHLYFTGDTEDTTELLEQRGLDVAFVTPWLWDAVRRAGRRIDARLVVIYHHRSGETVEGCEGSCRVPAQGERWGWPAPVV